MRVVITAPRRHNRTKLGSKAARVLGNQPVAGFGCCFGRLARQHARCDAHFNLSSLLRGEVTAPPPSSRHVQVRYRAVGLVTRGGPARARRATSRESGPVFGNTRTFDVRTHVVPTWCSLLSSRPAQVRCREVGSIARGGRAQTRRTASRESGPIPGSTRTHARTLRKYVRPLWSLPCLLSPLSARFVARARPAGERRACSVCM